MSLIFLENEEKTIPVHSDCYNDLAMEELITGITSNLEEQQIIRKVFGSVPDSYETVIYRQQVLKDFLANPDMCEELEDALGKLQMLKDYKDNYRISNIAKGSIWDLLDYLHELGVYVDVIEDISNVFKDKNITSEALKSVAERVENVKSGDGIQHIRDDIKEIRADISTTQSVTLGVNLSSELYPENIKILGFYNGHFNIDTCPVPGEMATLEHLHGQNSFMKYMTKEVEKHLSKCVRRMKKVFRQYVDIDGYFLVDLYDELRYYISIARFYRRLNSEGYSICIPELRKDMKEIAIQSVYNIRLALKKEANIVKNDFVFSAKERIYILTGPNRGGKSILTQGVGLVAFMASMGLFVTADSYKGYIVKQIFTHFPADENTTMNYGRLGEEAIRIQQIVKEADENSMVLLNETYSTTCASDGLYLAKDLVHVLKQKNIATIYNTHIHELAKATGEMNAWEGESDVISIIMEIVNNQNTFRVVKSEPDICSYAKNIAEKYGITYEQMMSK